MSSETPLPIGTRLGSYRITGRIGEGGMGTVYSAEHVELGKHVAIKTLRSELAANTQVRARFVREGRAAAAVRHAHVVDVHDVGVHGEIPYLVMELLQGHDLSAHVARAGKLQVGEVADLMLPVLTAMSEAHAAGIVHRDLKPENIFLQTGPGKTWIPKVLDFGISKLRDPESMNLTGSGTLLGTPYYMSPEQASSARDVDARADLYSIGVILYHCVSGQVPFQGSSLVQVIGQILTAMPPPLRESAPDVPSAFETVVKRAMAKDADARFQTARDLARALLPFASDRSRLNFEHLLAAAGDESAHSSTQLLPNSDPQTSTLDPTANSVVTERQPSSRSSRALLVGAAAVAVTIAVVIALRMRHEPAAAAAPAHDGSAATPTSSAPAAATTAAPGVAQPANEVPVAPNTVAPVAPTTVSADSGTSKATPQASRPAHSHSTARHGEHTAPAPSSKPPADDPFSERK